MPASVQPGELSSFTIGAPAGQTIMGSGRLLLHHACRSACLTPSGSHFYLPSASLTPSSSGCVLCCRFGNFHRRLRIRPFDHAGGSCDSRRSVIVHRCAFLREASTELRKPSVV